MAKKKATGNKVAVKEAKKAKSALKIVRKEVKTQKKSKVQESQDDVDDNDLEGILDRMRIEWEEKHRVTEETVEGPPSRRANATLTPDPNALHLWCIGGEFFSDDGRAHFYNDVYRYTPEKNEWRRYTSATCPGPRSAHAVVASPAAGGKLFLSGGEFSSLHQTTFHHYRDFWEFDLTSRSWERIETKIKPSARSGHRMAMWKHLIVLFGGFYDPGIRTQYLSDLWVFDTQEYTWQQIEIRDTDRRPSPRSGFSFIPTAEGIVLHGGYCKEYVKGKRVQGIALEDTWYLKMSTNLKELKWERRKKSGYAPSIRSGCTMTLWANKDVGVLFGGVKDDDQSEETLVSEFYNDLYGYHTLGPGRWSSLMLKKAKKRAAGGRRQKQVKPIEETYASAHSSSDDERSDPDSGNEVKNDPKERHSKHATSTVASRSKQTESQKPVLPLKDEGDEFPIIPLPRYNAMLAVLRNTLYIYGGILERGSREITLDDFWSLALDKMDAYVCLKSIEVDVEAGGEESSEDDDGDDDDDDDDDDEDDFDKDEQLGEGSNDVPVEALQVDTAEDEEMEHESEIDDGLRAKATEFLNASKTMSTADAVGIPLPGETLATFYERTRDYWVQQAFVTSTNRGKELRRDGFALAEDRYSVYKPLLKEVEKILGEAGLDAEEMKTIALGATGSAGTSRNRR